MNLTDKIISAMPVCKWCRGGKRIDLDINDTTPGTEISALLVDCTDCNGTSKEPIETMEIIGYLVDADRAKHITSLREWTVYDKASENRRHMYHYLLANTKGDHLAAAYIRLVWKCDENQISDIVNDSEYVDTLQEGIHIVSAGGDWEIAACIIIQLCKSKNIDLEKHVLARLEYEK